MVLIAMCVIQRYESLTYSVFVLLLQHTGFEVTFGNYQLDLTGRTHITKTMNQIIDNLIADANALESQMRAAVKK